MIEILKSLFGKKKKDMYIPYPPGRTFKRVLTGGYFGCEDVNADENRIAKAKQGKIDQITELGLMPMFIRYSYEDTGKNKRGIQAGENHPDPEVSSVHVVFQKEVFEKSGTWSMLLKVHSLFIVPTSMSLKKCQVSA